MADTHSFHTMCPMNCHPTLCGMVAVVEGDELVIDGQKVWTTSAQYADKGFIVLRTNPDVPKHDGISFALIDMKQPGIDVRPLRQLTGSVEFYEVFFDDVRTPAENIVGKRGEGWLVSRTTLKHERAGIGTALGLLHSHWHTENHQQQQDQQKPHTTSRHDTASLLRYDW